MGYDRGLGGSVVLVPAIRAFLKYLLVTDATGEVIIHSNFPLTERHCIEFDPILSPIESFINEWLDLVKNRMSLGPGPHEKAGGLGGGNGRFFAIFSTHVKAWSAIQSFSFSKRMQSELGVHCYNTLSCLTLMSTLCNCTILTTALRAIGHVKRSLILRSTRTTFRIIPRVYIPCDQPSFITRVDQHWHGSITYTCTINTGPGPALPATRPGPPAYFVLTRFLVTVSQTSSRYLQAPQPGFSSRARQQVLATDSHARMRKDSIAPRSAT
ncbi:uncharacterized protein H6S33_007692 [Morchella sextelata]|uniref:uncharacterized protein n=1 Tax=Morchella sextelata TaxID=1174677 RepID=UPI001D0521C3|nr:uncharacterized protein H6S33_007692 [Morchella sextelata]KAH0603370.1 hypothetical protein H6S33_007692 [Morchella sextelata]